MNSAAIFTHWSNILDSLLDDDNFCKLYFQDPCRLLEGIPLTDSINMCCGASRGCLVDDNYDYCVKFNMFNQDEYRYYHYCEREERIYEAAIEENLNQYFAEAKYIGTYCRTIDFIPCGEVDVNFYEDEYGYITHAINNLLDEEGDTNFATLDIAIPLFAYPKATAHIYRYSHAAERNRAKTIVSPLAEKNVGVATEFIHYYGFDEYVRLSNFLNYWKINDCHGENAMDINNKFVLTDYSGYHDGDSYTDVTSYS